MNSKPALLTTTTAPRWNLQARNVQNTHTHRKYCTLSHSFDNHTAPSVIIARSGRSQPKPRTELHSSQSDDSSSSYTCTVQITNKAAESYTVIYQRNTAWSCKKTIIQQYINVAGWCQCNSELVWSAKLLSLRCTSRPHFVLSHNRLKQRFMAWPYFFSYLINQTPWCKHIQVNCTFRHI